MSEENYLNIKSLNEGVDEIINQICNNNYLLNLLLNNKKYFDNFNSLLCDLNNLVTQRKEISRKDNQISLF